MHVRMKYLTVVLLLHQSMFESLTVMHPQLLAQLEALQEQKSMCLYVLLDNTYIYIYATFFLLFYV